ncbi:sesquipedalian-1-like [Rhinophrynus dorsalis]
MKLEFSSLLSSSAPEKQGYLLKKGNRPASYHRRWFLLWGNLLLYFERQGDPQPLGLILLEGSSISLRSSRLEYAFSLYTLTRVYKMAAECQQDLELWVKALLSANRGYTKELLGELRGQYLGLTAGQNDPTTPQPQERMSNEGVWGGDFGVLHRWLGEEILPLRETNLIDLH